MSIHEQDYQEEKPTVGAGYAGFQLSKALTTQAHHVDAKTRERAGQRVADWTGVFESIVNGTLAVGSRTPLQGVPNWATLKVVTGGFATGDLLAGGSLHEHERTLLANIPATPDSDARRALNSYYLTDAGLNQLQGLLESGCYELAPRKWTCR